MKKRSADPPTAILAAGGILRGNEANEGKIAVVRRHRYGGETGLPKGKVKDNEDVLATALREVREETGYQAEIEGYAGTTHYHVGRHPKAVFYFIMRIAGSSRHEHIDDKEIDAVEWLTPAEAASALTHSEDRNLIAALFNLPRRSGS